MRLRKKRHDYRPPQAPSRCLDPAFFAPTVHKATDAWPDDLPGELYEIWKQVPDAHKWVHYLARYAAAAASLREQPIRMLEIGVYRGGSIELWKRYLHPDSVIVGIDIDPDCRVYDRPADKVHVRIGDQSDGSFLREIVRDFGPFDFILDDGSHVSSLTIASFNHLFLEGLKSPGLYLVEDTHTAYWRSHRDQRYSFMDLAKDLVDLMHSHYRERDSELYFRRGAPERAASVTVPAICSAIASIEFHDSIVLIHKRRRDSLPSTIHPADQAAAAGPGPAGAGTDLA